MAFEWSTPSLQGPVNTHWRRGGIAVIAIMYWPYVQMALSAYFGYHIASLLLFRRKRRKAGNRRWGRAGGWRRLFM